MTAAHLAILLASTAAHLPAMPGGHGQPGIALLTATATTANGN